MRRRDLLTIAATQQVRETQEGVNYFNFKPLNTTLSLDSFTIHFQLSDMKIEPINSIIIGDFNCQIFYGYGGDQPRLDARDPMGNILFFYFPKKFLKGIYTLTFNKGIAMWYHNGVFISEMKGFAEIQQINLHIMYSVVRRDAAINSLRIFNYALTAEQITTLYNNGAPEEYVLPTHYKTCIPEYNYHHNFANGNNTSKGVDKTTVSYDNINKWLTGVSTNNYIQILTPNCLSAQPNKWGIYKCSVTVKGKPNFISLQLYIFTWNTSYNINPSTGIYNLNTDTTTYYGVNVSDPIFDKNSLTSSIYTYFNNVPIGAEIKILSIDVDPVVCIAEYIPQNLVTAHDGDASDKTPIAWLDSAKQLPLNDEYLPPLLQGVGGYDLTALGAPEIMDKPRVIQRQEITNFSIEGDISAGGGNAGQVIATLKKTIIGSILNCFGDYRNASGNINNQYPRLVCSANQRVGAGTVRMTLEYMVSGGNMELYAIETYGWNEGSWTNLHEKLGGKHSLQLTSIGLPIDNSVTPRLDFSGITRNGGEYYLLVKKLIIEEYDRIIN